MSGSGAGRSAGPTVAVVGGGITGLAAAWQLANAPDRPAVVLLESDSRLGGKILTGPDGVEYGPDAFLARVPHAIELCRELGLEPELVSPATGQAWLWWRGRLRRLPAGLVLGVPSDLPAVARSGIIGPLGLARAGLDLILPAARHGDQAGSDRSVGEIVSGRFGRQVQARLVDPLLGGINAGRTELLSAQATAPQLDAAARSNRSLLLGLRRQAAQAGGAGAGGGPAGPVFLAHPKGLGHVVDRLAASLADREVDIRTETAVRAVTRDRGGFELVTDGGTVGADGLIVCTPAPVSAALLSSVAPQASDLLGAIEHASVTVVTFTFPRSALVKPFAGSGFLVPRADGRLMTAATFMTSKWQHVSDSHADQMVVRVSAGRYRDERAWRLDDAELISAVQDELADATGLTGAPLSVVVTRWPVAFPQYAVGHLDRVAAVESAVERERGLAVAGAAMRGVGIPACIAQGRQAADRALAHLRAGAAA